MLKIEINELRAMLKLFDNGEITTKQVEVKLRIYKETHKRYKLQLDAMILCAGNQSPLIKKTRELLLGA